MTRVKILQWNIWFQEKVENIIELVQEINPDILCFQELTIGFEVNNNQHVAKIISEKIGFEYNFALAHKFNNNQNQGNGIFSKFPIIENSNFIIVNAKKSDSYSYQGRICAFSKIQLDNEKYIYVATTHSSYNHRFLENEAKIDEIKRLLDSLRDYNKSFILTGDLNVTPNSQSIKLIEKQLIHCGPNYKEPTWTTKPFSYNGFEEDKLKWRLDYVFATKDIKIINSKIIKTKYSDHLPILIEIEI